jgi:DNA-binding transcriptional MerR regulator
MTLSQAPAYNIKVVLNKTGIAADTLRAWERRYGLPMPQRTAGGHRLYSDRDVEIIKWLMSKQQEGLSISRAVDLWNEQIDSGTDPLAEAQKKQLVPPDSKSIEALRREWLTACFNYDTATAEQILNQAFATHSVEIICTEVIMRGLYEIGEFWHKGKASVQQEHFASGIATRRLEALINATPPPTRNETVLLACPPNEWHAFPLLITNLFLRRRGWDVVYLGANVPITRIEETVKATDPKLVILSTQTLVNAVQLREMARTLNKKGIQVGFGGRVFNTINGLSQRIPAHFLGNTIEYAIPTIESLIASPKPAPKEERINKSTLDMAGKFHEMRIEIERTIIHIFETSNQPGQFLETANHFLGSNLIATLELGNINYLSMDMRWLGNLLINHDISIALLPIYLETYAVAIKDVMGDEGKEISDWLNLEAAKHVK